jgi:hypothetical protein
LGTGCGSSSHLAAEAAGSAGDAGDDTSSGGAGVAGAGRGGSGAGDANGGSVSSGGRAGSAGALEGGGSAGLAAGTGGRSGAGGAGASGASSSGGTDACGPCPGFACGPPVSFTVSAAEGVIGDLVAMSSSVTIDCSGSGVAEPCVWICQSREYQLPYGTHTIELVSTGYQTKTIEFELEAPLPESCGCCGWECGHHCASGACRDGACVEG